MSKNAKEISKFLSFVLRHDPGSIGLSVDSGGWADLESLIARAPFPLTVGDIGEVVETSDKQRFALSSDGTRIRANQGHSFTVDLGLSPVTAPDNLYHGTAEQSLVAILNEGLQRRSRQHVHLSSNIETARLVGIRHGVPVVLRIDARAMQGDGLAIYRSANGVWLTEAVPAKYLTVVD